MESDLILGRAAMQPARVMQEISREIYDVLAFGSKYWIFADKMIDVGRQWRQGTVSDTNILTTLELWK